MEWRKEKGPFEKAIESFLDGRWLEMRFGEELLEILHHAPNKSAFLRKARKEAKSSDLWIREDLCSLVNNLPDIADYYS